MSAAAIPPDAAEALIDHALAARWNDMAEPTREAARTLLHDTLAVAVAGVRADHADAILAMAQSWGQGTAAGVLGRPGVRLPATSAAFVNAFQSHGQEYDCVHEAAVLHPMATIVAALLAEAERGASVSGLDFLTAIIAGVDVAVALGLAAPGPLRFFRPATAGIFGSVAAIVRLRHMPRDMALDAFGHALAFASGTMQAHLEGRPALPVQVANAARNALVAVDLARAGMPGVRGAIDGPFGYLALFEAITAMPAALAALGRPHAIEQVSCKPYPTGRAAQGGIVAVEMLMAGHSVGPDDIDALDYHAPPLIARLVGRSAYTGMATSHARLCLPWLAAVTLHRGSVGLGDFNRASLDDADILALSQRVSVVADDTPDPAAFAPATLVARLRGGQTVQVRTAALLGSPQLRLTAAQHDAKARGCLDYAGLGPCHAALADALARLEASVDVAATLRATGVLG